MFRVESVYFSVYALATVDQMLGSSVQLSHGSFSWLKGDVVEGPRRISRRTVRVDERECKRSQKNLVNLLCVTLYALSANGLGNKDKEANTLRKRTNHKLAEAIGMCARRRVRRRRSEP